MLKQNDKMNKFLWAIVPLIAVNLAAWITHLWWSLSGLFSGSMNQINEYVIAILGAFIPPIGIIHGIYLWF